MIYIKKNSIIRLYNMNDMYRFKIKFIQRDSGKLRALDDYVLDISSTKISGSFIVRSVSQPMTNICRFSCIGYCSFVSYDY